MPRAKRTLAETDSNAEAVAPVAKRTSTGKAPEKENDAPAAAKKRGKVTVSALLNQLIYLAKIDETTKQASTKAKKSVAKEPEPKDASSATTGSKKASVSSCWYIVLATRLSLVTDFKGASRQGGQICHRLEIDYCT